MSISGRSKTSTDKFGGQLRREVYGLLGMPIDVVDMAAVLRKIERAISDAAPFLLSTANLNFLMMSRKDTEFRDVLLLSDLCSADGIAIVWLGRLLGVPIKQRIAGADIFDRLKSNKHYWQSIEGISVRWRRRHRRSRL